jgi:hypothetical protein
LDQPCRRKVQPSARVNGPQSFRQVLGTLKSLIKSIERPNLGYYSIPYFKG